MLWLNSDLVINYRLQLIALLQLTYYRLRSPNTSTSQVTKMGQDTMHPLMVKEGSIRVNICPNHVQTVCNKPEEVLNNLRNSREDEVFSELPRPRMKPTFNGTLGFLEKLFKGLRRRKKGHSIIHSSI